MSKLSRDEKRGRLLEIFHEGQDFHQLKDLEKMAKDKGLNQNQVKEILGLLIDDGLVDSDKIGSTLFYWSFPNKALKMKQKKLDELRGTKQALNDKLFTLEAALKSEQTSQGTQNDSDKLKRDRLSNEIVSLNERERDLLDFIKQNEAMDPEKALKLRSDAKELCEAANRWTDNVLTMKSWCVKKFNVEEKELNKQFKIPADFDYMN